ncbi:hypothetical protein COX28_00475 [Candidatus Kuenenbacteria bacterium CG23_combo_of_CG06-09_8_20_14_all_39_39]|uniref:Polymerase nucleotidyl transferase domain-containing protein n=1 Tax=Candidatus Kuenenbacteria bacterium CG23_combo_of_CG06-09_8_20_14_all_39_39 TaxID=1974623 RepID=A0A2G9Z7N8_9BACT|nr:MAG: hypothetical protein COX28_00475 [Candidatus Kuenenbacteria bacterium CG23_combo_of_CG06-09_8_20_14_all_39_39]
MDSFDEDLYIFKKHEVKKLYHPLDFYKNISMNKDKSEHIKNAIELIESISNLIGVDKNYIGIEGSTLLFCFNRNSDIDVLIYGYNNAIKVANKFRLLNNNKNIRFYNKKDFNNIIKDRKMLGYGRSKTAILTQELRRFYGFIRNKRFSIINVLSNEDKPIIDLKRKIKCLGLFKNELFITEDKYSIVSPGVILGKDKEENKYRIELINPYGINQAKKTKSFSSGEKFMKI